MSKSDRRFARFYFDDFQRDYPDVYADDPAFAAWMRLLVLAEKAWPAVPELPRSIKARSLRTLADCGLVAVGPNHTFAVKGYNVERSRRHGIAVAAATAKWDASASANGDANAHASEMPRRERDENENESPLPRRAGKRSNGTNPRALRTNPRANGTSPRQEREAQKRGPSALHEILSSIQTGPNR